MPDDVENVRPDTNSNKDLDTLAREELLRLHRQYRLMESTRTGFAKESGTTVAREHRRLAFLEEEKEDLITDLTNALAVPNQEKDRETIRMILELLDKLTEHQLEIRVMLGHIDEMDEQVAKITRRVIQQKLKVQSLFGNSLTVAQAEKRARVLEDRLYHV